MVVVVVILKNISNEGTVVSFNLESTNARIINHSPLIPITN